MAHGNWRECVTYPECVPYIKQELLDLAEEMYPMKEFKKTMEYQDSSRFTLLSEWLRSWTKDGVEENYYVDGIAPHM